MWEIVGCQLVQQFCPGVVNVDVVLHGRLCHAGCAVGFFGGAGVQEAFSGVEDLVEGSPLLRGADIEALLGEGDFVGDTVLVAQEADVIQLTAGGILAIGVPSSQPPRMSQAKRMARGRLGGTPLPRAY